MPVAHMATIISISVLASFASGFLCLLVVGIKWASSVKRDLIGEEKNVITSRIVCARCGTSFFDNPQLGLKDVLCADCKWAVCSACALRYPFLWLCTACIKNRDKFTDKGDYCLKDLRQRFATIDRASRIHGRREREIRDLIEVLVENILGVCFENAKVQNLSNDIPYLDFIEKFEGVLSLTLARLKTAIQLIIDGVVSSREDNPSDIEQQLRGLIQDVIEDATNIDSTKISIEKHNIKYNIASKTYEDILSIAILNQVIENVSLLTPSESKSMDILLKMKESQNSFRECLGDIKLEAKIRELSDYTPIESNWTNFKTTSPELMLEFPKVERLGTRWEENWLFRRNRSDIIVSNNNISYKKRLVPMFLPLPVADISPQIGESNIEDISDLSDLSDSEVELLINEG